MTFTTKSEMLDLSDYSWQRTRRRLEGLTDDEYLWEPAGDCWSIRPRRDGAYRVDEARPAPSPAPLTTIAWRMHHLAGCYGSARNSRLLRVDTDDPGADLSTFPPTAEGGIGVLEQAHGRWRAVLGELDESILWDRIGPAAGQYAEYSVASFAFHMLDEFIHHGAEVGVLRDLWRARSADTAAAARSDAADLVVRGDRKALESLRTADPTEHPDLVLRAAEAGRWDVVVELAILGFDVNRGDRTPLHLASGGGDLDAVRVLVEHGADLTALDPEYKSTPLEWAQFFGRDDIAEYLKSTST